MKLIIIQLRLSSRLFHPSERCPELRAPVKRPTSGRVNIASHSSPDSIHRQVVNCFSNVCIVFNEDAIKYFFVNRALLKACKESTQEVSYVLLGSETSLVLCSSPRHFYSSNEH